jgi:hypothetical protein
VGPPPPTSASLATVYPVRLLVLYHSTHHSPEAAPRYGTVALVRCWTPVCRMLKMLPQRPPLPPSVGVEYLSRSCSFFHASALGDHASIPKLV